MGRPEVDELRPQPGDLADPVGEEDHSPVPFVVRKHADRALLLITGRCHFYCRFCFRRAPLGTDRREPRAADLTRALDYLAAEEDLREVILSGGDPLVLGDRRLASLLGRLATIPHLRQVRIHTRAPVHHPARITGALTTALRCRLPVRVVVHFNHPSEVTTASRRAVRRLQATGIQVLNQAVLLRGVNDDVGTLATLCRALARAAIRPYYLHHPDRAPGNATFRLTLDRGLALYAGLRAEVTGSALPAYVIDLPGGHGKVPVEALQRLDARRFRWKHAGTGAVVELEDIRESPWAVPGGGDKGTHP
jgi:lysine 2,3-aminomutase